MRRASFLVRLALALLALLGPAAPVLVRQVDAVAQSAGPAPERAPQAAPRVARADVPLELATRRRVDPSAAPDVPGPWPARRFLLHHAWLN